MTTLEDYLSQEDKSTELGAAQRLPHSGAGEKHERTAIKKHRVFSWICEICLAFTAVEHFKDLPSVIAEPTILSATCLINRQ